MTSDADMDFDDDQTEADESGPPALRRQLKEANRRARDAEERANSNEAAARRVAFLDAGIPDSPQTRFFMEKYDGALNGEAIKTAAQAHGFMAAQEAETQAEIDKIAEMSQASQGAESPEARGSEEAMEREMREAAETASRTGGDVGEAIAGVQRRYNRPTTLDTQ